MHSNTPTTAAAVFAANRARGAVVFDVHAREGVTRRGSLHESGSLRVRFPSPEAEGLSAVFVNTAGAIGREHRRCCGGRVTVHPLNPDRRTVRDRLGLPSQRHLAADLGLVETSAIAGIFDCAAVHHREIVAELAGKVEILLDQHDGDVTEIAQI